MSEKDIEVVMTKIEEEKEYLNSISQDIWRMPELQYKEVQAHAILTCALRRYGFYVHKHYFMPTAFRAELTSKMSGGGPTIAILLEYDALPEIGHACGHNLVAEAGLAAALGIKTAMEADPLLNGKLVVLGTPAEEGGGGKIGLLELGAFDDVDVAMMVHPAMVTYVAPRMLCNVKYLVEFKGKETHAGFSWSGINALDAAVACYQSIAHLRQQIKPSCKIYAIITKGGTVENVIPAESSMRVQVRALTKGELLDLQRRVEACMTSAAEATGCEVQFRMDKANAYESLITNQVLANTFRSYAESLGLKIDSGLRCEYPGGSTDMGNVSHIVPSIHPLYSIPTKGINHTKQFALAAGAKSAQEPTLLVSKAMALTALQLMRCPQMLREVKRQFETDVAEDASMMI